MAAARDFCIFSRSFWEYVNLISFSAATGIEIRLASWNRRCRGIRSIDAMRLRRRAPIDGTSVWNAFGHQWPLHQLQLSQARTLRPDCPLF